MSNWEKEETQEQKKGDVSMTDRFLIAMLSPKEYGKLLKLPTKKVVSYLFCLLVLLTIIQVAIPMFGALAGMGGMKKMILEKIPAFELKDGKFHYDERVEINDEQSGVYILVDTTQDAFTDEDVIRKENAVETILVSSSNMIVSNYLGDVEAMRQNYLFSDFKDMEMTNETLVRYIPFFYMCMIVGVIVSFFVLLVRYLISALIYAGFIYGIEKFLLQKDLRFGQTYKVALFAKTIGSIVLAVSICAGGTLAIMAADSFAIFTTIIIMNKVCVHKYLAV